MKQRGYNPKYPEEIEVWKRGNPIPSWLSDHAKVAAISGTGELQIEIRETSSGGYEIPFASGQGTLVNVPEKAGWVCRGGNGKIFSLSQRQLKLLYYDNRGKN